MSAADAQRHLANARARFAEGDLEAAAREAQAGLTAAVDPAQRATAIELRALRCEIDLVRHDVRVALRRAETEEESEDTAPLHHAHGRAALSLLEVPRALASLERAVALWRRRDEPASLAAALHDLGRAQHVAGRWGEAEASWGAALQLDEERGDAAAEAQDRAALARLAYDRGETTEQPSAPTPLARRRRHAEEELARGRREAALDILIDLAREAQHAEDRLEEAAAHRVAAAALRAQHDLDSAAWFVGRARELAAGAPLEEGRVEAEAGELFRAEGRIVEAAGAFDRAAKLFSRLGARRDLERAEARRRDLAPRLAPAVARMRVGERTLAGILEELLAGLSAEAGALLELDDAGRPGERAARGFEAEEAAALEALRAGGPLSVAGAVYAPLLLYERAAGVVAVAGAVDAALLAPLAARAALAVWELRHHASARRRAELAHEIRNPLAGILGFSDVLPEEAAEWPAKLVQLLGTIHHDALKLRRSIDGLLELTAVDSNSETTRISVRAMLGTVARRFVATTGEVADVDALAVPERAYRALAALVIRAQDSGRPVVLTARLEPPGRDPWVTPHGRVRIELGDGSRLTWPAAAPRS